MTSLSSPSSKLFSFFVLLALMTSFLAGRAQQNEARIREFQLSSCLGTAPAMPAYYNDVIKIGCDTVWLMNKTRYQLMTKAMDYVLKKDPDESLKLVSQYEQSLKSCTENYGLLMDKYALMSDELSKGNHASIAYMQDVNLNLEKAKLALAQANKNLEDTQKTLARKSKNTRLKNWLFGAGGLGTGLLLGIVFFGGS